MSEGLSGPRLEPASGGKARQIVLLLHGYGSSGTDLISLAPYWHSALPDALFFAPHGPEWCPGVPGGYQWWSLADFSRPALTAGARRAAPALEATMDAVLDEQGLDESALLVVGFSQGMIMALDVVPQRGKAVAGIIGLSGILADSSRLEAAPSRPPVLLLHGSADPLVPLACHEEAQRELKRHGFDVESHVMPGLGHSVDARELELGLGFARRVLGYRAG